MQDTAGGWQHSRLTRIPHLLRYQSELYIGRVQGNVILNHLGKAKTYAHIKDLNKISITYLNTKELLIF